MALAVLIAGVVAFLAGLLAMLYGIPIREFSVGSTFILVGAIGVCTGMLLAALYVVVAELKTIARRLAGQTGSSDVRVRPVLPGIPDGRHDDAGPSPRRCHEARSAPAAGGRAAALAGRAAARGPRADAPPVPDAWSLRPMRRAGATCCSSRPRARNASVRRARPRAVPGYAGRRRRLAPPTANFDDARPKADRARPAETVLPRRPASPSLPPPSPARMPPAADLPPVPPPAPMPPPAAPAPPPPPAAPPAVTVLKSGIVDGTAYSLYSDGSIEAQMPEGMMRFASIDELRSHLDQRG